MSTTTWILLGLIIVSLALYFVFTFAKKIDLITKISSSLLFPAISLLYIFLLFDYVPDSIHIIKLSIIALIFLTASYIMGTFSTNEKLNTVQRIFFLISLLPLASLFYSVFLIHRVPTWINVISGCTYGILFLLFFVIFIKKASFKFYIYSILSLIIASFINYCSLLSLCYNPVPYNIVRFIGTASLIGYLVFSMLNETVINLKLKKLISLMILLASIVLICLSNLMVLY